MIMTIKNIKKKGNDHFCSLSNCLIPNQFSGITMDPNTTIKSHSGIVSYRYDDVPLSLEKIYSINS